MLIFFFIFSKFHDLKEEVESSQQVRMHLELQVKVLTEKISFLQNGEADNHEHDDISRFELFPFSFCICNADLGWCN